MQTPATTIGTLGYRNWFAWWRGGFTPGRAGEHCCCTIESQQEAFSYYTVISFLKIMIEESREERGEEEPIARKRRSDEAVTVAQGQSPLFQT